MDFTKFIGARPLVARQLNKDFGAFVRAAWPVLHPGTKLSWTTGHDAICDFLTAVSEKKITRLIINCPPRFAKSSILNLFLVWLWLHDPTKSFLACSYEIDLSLNGNADRRRVMESKWFKDLFGDAFQISTDRSQAQEFSTTAGGTMQAASTNSKAQGRGGDLIVCDDPLSGDVAYSESFRNEVNFWFERQLPQRLNNPSESAIVVVMQRLHQNDPSGFLLSQENSEWVLLKLPLICEQDETIVFPHSGRVWHRKKGDCLDSRRWSPRTVRERQRNRLVFASQFQQSPMALEGNLVKMTDLVFYGGRDPQTGVMDPGLPEKFDRKIISVDCAFKDLRTSDYVAVIVVGILGSRRYLLHVTNAHLDLTGTENEIRNCHATFGPISATLVEDQANGASVVAHLREEIAGLVPVTPQGGKVARVVAASPEFQAHNWIVERNGPWTHKVIEQLCMFPNAKNDDITDAITQASIWLQSNSASLGLIDYLKSFVTGQRKLPPSAAERAQGAVIGRSGGITRVEGGKNEGQPQKCPLCGGPRIWMSTGTPGILKAHCNQEASDDGVLPAPPETANHTHKWREIPGGQQKCNDCELQRWIGTPPTVTGISRADYERGVGRRRNW